MFASSALDEREERAFIAIDTNLPFSECGTVFPDPRLVAAIVDRVTFNAHMIETGIQSYRLATSKTSSRKRASQGPRERAVHSLREPMPVRRTRSRASFSDSEVMGCPTVC
jgi:hypothetical protein